jgi:hypothetical protein
MFISATSTQRALMLSTLAWQDREMVETDESLRRALCKSARSVGEGGAQAPRVPILMFDKPMHAQNDAST